MRKLAVVVCFLALSFLSCNEDNTDPVHDAGQPPAPVQNSGTATEMQRAIEATRDSLQTDSASRADSLRP